MNNIKNQGLGSLYDDNAPTDEITIEEASVLLANDGTIAVPSVSASAYSSVFYALGAESVKVLDHTSSAGDWSFGVKMDGAWYHAWQNNRYPQCGFAYSMNNEMPYESFEELENFAFSA